VAQQPVDAARSPALVDFLTRRAAGWPGGLALVAVCLAAYLPGLAALPPVDGDETRYAEAARRMLRAGDLGAFVVPRIEDTPRLNKPPLVYWLQAASASILTGGHVAELSFPAALRGESRAERTLSGSPPTRTVPFTGGIWVYRVPSVLATILAVLITWRLGLRMFAPPCAWLAAALLAGCFLVVADARLARTDQVLLACTCAAQWALWNVWRARVTPARWVVLFWVAVGLGLMTKGPVTPAVAALTLLVLCWTTGEWAWLRRLRCGIGSLVLALLVVPWLTLAVRGVGWRPFAAVLVEELFERTVSGKAVRGGPPGYHLVLLPGLFWPGGLLVVPAFLYALRRGLRRPRVPANGPLAKTSAAGSTDRSDAHGRPWWRLVRGGRPAELFCLAWMVPAWVACELIGTKLPHYPLPLYPAVALLCGRAAWAASTRGLPSMLPRLAMVGDFSWFMIGVLLTIALPLFLAWRGGLRLDLGVLLALAASVILLTALLTAGWVAARRRQFAAALLIGLGASMIGGRGLFQTVLPNLREPWISSAVVREIAAIDPDARRPLAAAGYYLESLVFLTGGRVERIASSQLDSWLEAHPRGLAVVIAGACRSNPPLRRLAEIKGFNYVEGRSAVLHILEKAAADGASGPRQPATAP